MPKSSFETTQEVFTQRIRSAEFVHLPGVEDRRLTIYRELFYNNVESFVSGTFPVLKECVSSDTWHKMVRHFFIHHSCESPYFLEISEEFLQYLAADINKPFKLPTYAYSLAHWEWMELFADAYVANKPYEVTSIHLDEDALTTVECAWLQAYEHPVHEIVPNEDVEAKPTFLLIYRDAQLAVGFIELNPLSYILFEALSNNTHKTIKALVEDIAVSHGMPLQQLLPGALETIANWVDLQLIKKCE